MWCFSGFAESHVGAGDSWSKKALADLNDLGWHGKPGSQSAEAIEKEKNDQKAKPKISAQVNEKDVAILCPASSREDSNRKLGAMVMSIWKFLNCEQWFMGDLSGKTV